MRKLYIVLFLFISFLGFAQEDNFSKGEELFLNNKPDEALPYLQAAVAAPEARLEASLYLGIVYVQLGRAGESLALYRKILPDAGEYTALVAFNLGNLYYVRDELATAEDFYNQALDADPSFASAYLNRANTRLRRGERIFAISDYWQYLGLKSDSQKAPQIELLLETLQQEEDAKNAQDAEDAKRRADIEALNAAQEAEQKQQAAALLPAVQATVELIEAMSAEFKSKVKQELEEDKEGKNE